MQPTSQFFVSPEFEDTSIMHPELIKAAIRIRGSTPSAIGVELGISRMTVSHVINGHGTSARVARRISEITGKPISVLWPGKYRKLEQAPRQAAGTEERP